MNWEKLAEETVIPSKGEVVRVTTMGVTIDGARLVLALGSRRQVHGDGGPASPPETFAVGFTLPK